jgi:hypothetical protein
VILKIDSPDGYNVGELSWIEWQQFRSRTPAPVKQAFQTSATGLDDHVSGDLQICGRAA